MGLTNTDFLVQDKTLVEERVLLLLLGFCGCDGGKKCRQSKQQFSGKKCEESKRRSCTECACSCRRRACQPAFAVPLTSSESANPHPIKQTHPPSHIGTRTNIPTLSAPPGFLMMCVLPQRHTQTPDKHTPPGAPRVLCYMHIAACLTVQQTNTPHKHTHLECTSWLFDDVYALQVACALETHDGCHCQLRKVVLVSCCYVFFHVVVWWFNNNRQADTVGFKDGGAKEGGGSN